jgi:UDP-N-acetyl-D-galactosamine dehydrogenase
MVRELHLGIDNNKQPDMKFLVSAPTPSSTTKKRSDIIIFESAAYPIATEKIYLPIKENGHGLIFNEDF